ncbi:MAG: hypothetical protein LBF81_07255, partial [Prevotellaceae bacterium]|nr:hypothetical protein [Prevotellaceae bacterium]
ICCIMHLLLCITLRLGTGSSTARLVPRRSGRNDGVVGQWAVGSRQCRRASPFHPLPCTLCPKSWYKEELPVKKRTGSLFIQPKQKEKRDNRKAKGDEGCINFGKRL